MTRRGWMHDGGGLRLQWSVAHHHRVMGITIEHGVDLLLVRSAIPIARYPVELSSPSIFASEAHRVHATVNQRTHSRRKAYR